MVKLLGVPVLILLGFFMVQERVTPQQAPEPSAAPTSYPEPRYRPRSRDYEEARTQSDDRYIHLAEQVVALLLTISGAWFAAHRGAKQGTEPVMQEVTGVVKSGSTPSVSGDAPGSLRALVEEIKDSVKNQGKQTEDHLKKQDGSIQSVVSQVKKLNDRVGVLESRRRDDRAGVTPASQIPPPPAPGPVLADPLDSEPEPTPEDNG